MNRRIFSLLLVFAMVIAMVPVDQAEAVTTSSYSPYAKIDYAYSSSVTCGTVRYISQVSSDSYFYSSYWPSSTFGYYTGPSVECGTASISMALSYIGVNKTPNDILSANNGATSFSTGWGGSTYYSYSASNLSGAMDAYINGNGKYSPPVIHIPGYSAAGHYVVVVGKISSGVYQILDPWQRALTQMTVSGSSATYTVYGSTIYDTIDQIHQWYNGIASLDYASGCTSYASYCQIKASKATVVNTQPCSAGSNAYATTYGYRATAYANTVLSGNSDAKTKALMVAMLNYGAAAQTYFSHNTDSLMNASLTEAQKALVEGYRADMLGAIVPADSSKTAAFPKDSTCYTPRIAVGFEGAFAVNYYFTPKHTPDGELTMYYWDAATYNSVDAMTRENATSVMTLEKQSDGSYLGAVEGIAAKEVDSTIYVALVYTSGGTEYCSGILAYSLGTYFKSVAGGTSTAQPLGAAVAVYSYCAKCYFEK